MYSAKAHLTVSDGITALVVKQMRLKVMYPTNVNLTSVTSDNVAEIQQKYPEASRLSQVNLGARDQNERGIEAKTQGLKVALSQRVRQVFLLEWTGTKIPRGVEVKGKAIGWTQHGFVTSDDQRDIGTYDRLEEFSGPDGKSHAMIIYCF